MIGCTHSFSRRSLEIGFLRANVDIATLVHQVSDHDRSTSPSSASENCAGGRVREMLELPAEILPSLLGVHCS